MKKLLGIFFILMSNCTSHTMEKPDQTIMLPVTDAKRILAVLKNAMLRTPSEWRENITYNYNCRFCNHKESSGFINFQCPSCRCYRGIYGIKTAYTCFYCLTPKNTKLDAPDICTKCSGSPTREFDIICQEITLLKKLLEK